MNTTQRVLAISSVYLLLTNVLFVSPTLAAPNLVPNLATNSASSVTPLPAPTLPASGMLSETTTQGTGSAKIDMPWGADSSKTNAQAPISGSVNRASPRVWTASIFNNSPTDSFSVSVKVTQKGQNGNVVKSDFFSASLAPGKSDERPISAATNGVNARLELLSWKKTKSTATGKSSDTASAQ